ncbi:MAG TPA: hypothetical protein PKO07_14480, partial [Pseudomonadota bacterium]|nr:hypothetical protein [Pseudomonadota bacterium]
MSHHRPRFDSHALSHKLRNRSPARWQLDGFRESAVLVPLVVPQSNPSGDPEVLFIVRTASLPTHA